MKIICGRVAFTLFGLDIYWYGVIIAAALLVAFLLAMLLVRKKNIEKDLPFEILIAAIPLGIVCARFFDCLFDSSLTLADYFNFRNGGMSIIGAIIGGAIGLVLLKVIKKRDILVSADLIVVVLILAQGIGRWGNYFNNEVYGRIITDPAGQFFPFAVNISGSWYEALFFYESVLDCIGFVILLIIYLKTKIKGVSCASYLIYYGTIRSILEPHRQAEYILKLGSLRISLVISLLMIAIGIALLIYCLVKRKNKEMLYE